MLLAVIADIHANLEALLAVLADMDERGPKAVVSLGDNVGYGPDPEAVLAMLADRNIPSVRGNHEWALIDPFRERGFNPLARQALERTRDLLSAAWLTRLTDLPASLSLYGFRFVHGLPPNDTNKYLFEAAEATLRRAFIKTSERISFVGHTHMCDAVTQTNGAIRRFELTLGQNVLDPGQRHIVNVGSVGQPRDGDNRAKYALYNDVAHVLELRAVSYDIAAVAEKIVARGLPRRYADRLW